MNACMHVRACVVQASNCNCGCGVAERISFPFLCPPSQRTVAGGPNLDTYIRRADAAVLTLLVPSSGWPAEGFSRETEKANGRVTD